MKTHNILRIIVATLFLTLGAGTSQAGKPPADDGGGDANAISACGYLIDEPGYYYLTGELTGEQVNNCVTVSFTEEGGGHVTIDLKGYGMNGIDFAGGIALTGNNIPDNIEIRNGTVRGFYSGITSNVPTNAVRVIDVRVLDNVSTGISIQGYAVTVKGCTVHGNGSQGIGVGENSVITDNVVTDNGTVGMGVGRGTRAENNTVAGNGGDGISVGWQGATVRNNNVYNNQGYGVNFFGPSSRNHLVDGNTVNDNILGNINYAACPSCTFGLNHAP